MADRYYDKAREIMDEVIRKHGDFYVTPTTVDLAAAILCAAVKLAREEIRASASLPREEPGKPVHCGMQVGSDPLFTCTRLSGHDGDHCCTLVPVVDEPPLPASAPSPAQPAPTVDEIIEVLRAVTDRLAERFGSDAKNHIDADVVDAARDLLTRFDDHRRRGMAAVTNERK